MSSSLHCSFAQLSATMLHSAAIPPPFLYACRSRLSNRNLVLAAAPQKRAQLGEDTPPGSSPVLLPNVPGQ
eukprot:scaffold322771_cov19-Tisochrysis_lutea.AAC.1